MKGGDGGSSRDEDTTGNIVSARDVPNAVPLPRFRMMGFSSLAAFEVMMMMSGRMKGLPKVHILGGMARCY